MSTETAHSLRDKDLANLTTLTTANTLTTDYVLVIDTTTGELGKITIDDMNTLHDSIT